MTAKAEIQESISIWNDNDLQIVGTLTYMGSASSYTPVDILSGNYGIEMCNEAEGNLVKEPYLTSCSQEQYTGVLDNGYDCYFKYGTYLCVTQPHYYSNTTGTRDAVAYYRVDVINIDTQLLYRPERAENTISIVVAGIVLIGVYSVLKWVRR